jgi:putative transposase
LLKQKAYKFQLKTNKRQERLFAQFSGCQRFVWNKALALQKQQLDNNEKLFSYNELSKQLTSWKKEEHLFLKETASQPLQQTLKNLERALKEALNKKNVKKFPKFKKRGLKESYKYPAGVKVEQNNSRMFLPKIGFVNYINSREVKGVVKNVTVSKKCNHWYASVQVEQEVETPIHHSNSIVGIDVGVKKFAQLSSGQEIKPINSFRKHERKLRKLQRRLSKKQKFSSNWKKLRDKISNLYSKISNVRKDFLHKTTDKISKNHAVVVLEYLKVKNMSKSSKGDLTNPGRNVQQKSGLNKSILDQGWFEFRRKLEYKLRWRGGLLLTVDAKYTSQKCSSCAFTHKDNRKSQEHFKCLQCGLSVDADLNASKNILEAGLALLACGEVSFSSSVKQEPTMKTTDVL